MADLDDVQAYGRKFQNQLEKVREADIDERDRDAILTFIRRLSADDDVNQGTMGARLNHLRLTSERADTPLVEMDHDAVNEYLFDLKHERGLADGTRRNYRKSLRKFFQQRDEEWADDIKIGASPSRSVDPDELLTDEEINDLLDACENPRDKALIALLADTGLRISAIASLRVRDIDLEGQTGMLSINEDGNVKGASGTVPLTWSEGFVGSWLQVHPRRNEPDAALIHQMRGYYEGGDGAMTYQYLSRRVRRIAGEADVDAERVNTHNFRKTAISRWIREGLSEQAIKHRATWDVDSDQMKTYSGVRDEELNDQILDHYGIERDAEVSAPDLDSCPRCNTPLRTEHDYCPGCASPLNAAAADRLDGAESDIVGGMGKPALGHDVDDGLQSVFQAVKNDPAARQDLVRFLDDVESGG